MPASVKSVRSAVSDPAAFATTLVAALVADWGTAWLDWDPTTIRDELSLGLQIDLPQAQFDRLMAGVATLTTDRFHRNLPAFVTLCGALNGDGYDPDHFDPPSIEDLAWGITEAVFLSHFVHGPTAHPDEFSPQIRGFIGSACDHEGLTNPPDMLRLAIHDRPARRAHRLASWSQDPDMDQSISHAQGRKVQAINNELRGRLRLLLTQLGHLFDIPVADIARLVGTPR